MKVTEFTSNIWNGIIDLPLNNRSIELTVSIFIPHVSVSLRRLKVSCNCYEIDAVQNYKASHSISVMMFMIILKVGASRNESRGRD
jgi:hypothetical protein